MSLSTERYQRNRLRKEQLERATRASDALKPIDTTAGVAGIASVAAITSPSPRENVTAVIQNTTNEQVIPTTEVVDQQLEGDAFLPLFAAGVAITKIGNKISNKRLIALGFSLAATGCALAGDNQDSSPTRVPTAEPVTITQTQGPETPQNAPATVTAISTIEPATQVAETKTPPTPEIVQQPRWTIEQIEAIGPGHVKQYELNDNGQFNELMISAGAYGPLQLTDEFHPACYDNQPFQCNALVASTIESIGTETGRASFILKTPDGGILIPASEAGDTWKNEPIINDLLSEVVPPSLLQAHDGKQLDVVQLFDIGINENNQIAEGRFDRIALVHEGIIVAVHHVGAQMDGFTQLQIVEPGIMFGTESPLTQNDPSKSLELVVSVAGEDLIAAYHPYRLGTDLPGLINTDSDPTDGFGNIGYWKFDKSIEEWVWFENEVPTTATPEPITLSEIDPFDPEIRMYHRNQDGEAREIPYGAFFESPGIHDLSYEGYLDGLEVEGLKELYLSAILVDKAYFDESDDSLTYPLGIPDASGNINIFYLKEFVSGPEGEHFHLFTRAYNIGKGARASSNEDYSKYPLEDIMPWLHQIVGRQVLFQIVIDENGGSEKIRNFTISNIGERPEGVVPNNIQATEIDPLNPEACGEDDRCRRLTNKTNNRLNGFLETNDSLWAIINENPGKYDGQTIIPYIINKHIPLPPRS